MKIDLTQLKDLASQVPDLLSKGQQVITAAQNMLKPFQGRGNKPDTKKKTADKKAPAEIAAAVAPVKNDKPAVKSTNKTAGETKKQSDEKPNNMAAVTESLSTALAVTETINQLIKQAGETMRFCNEQETFRTEIRAKAEVEIRKIDAMADMVRDYLNRSFDERAGLFDSYFSVLDKALEKGDNTLVVQTLQSINSLAVSSPFKDLADINKVTAMLENNEEWDI